SPTVRVQNRDGELLDAVVDWSTSAPLVVEVSSTGTVTARGNGSASILVSAGDVTKSIPVTVVQAPSSLEVLAGGAQSGIVDQVLMNQIRVRLLDRLGAPIAGASIAFSVSAGGGSATPVSTTTDGDGVASAQWKLGTVAGGAQ